MREKKSRKKKWLGILLIILSVLLVIRIILPFIVIKVVNTRLGHLKSYRGHIGDFDLNLLHGGYRIHDIYFHRIDSASGEEIKFLDIKMIDMRLEWTSLFHHGRKVGHMRMHDPELRFTKGKTEPAQIKKDTADLRLVQDMMPLKPNRLEIMNATIRYVDRTTKPGVDAQIEHLHAEGYNLQKVVDSSNVLPARIRASAELFGGTLDLNAKLDPKAKQPTFDLAAEAKNINLPRLNDFFRTYGRFDVNKGTFGLYTELAASKGKIAGYIKPVIKDLDVLGPEDKNKSFFQKFREGFIGTLADLFKNRKHDELGAKIMIDGSLKNVNINIWYVISEVLSNAFVQALRPALDNDISINSVGAVNEKEKEKKGGFLKKLFGKKKKRKEKK